MNPINKPAWKTTEFWVTIATLVVSLFVGSGIISQSEGSQATNASNQLIAAVVNAVTVFFYIKNRMAVKEKEAELIAHNPQLCTACAKKLSTQEQQDALAEAEKKLQAAQEEKVVQEKLVEVEKKLDEVEKS